MDVVAVAEDLARKVRAGAREPYTHRGIERGLASWVAAEVKAGGNRKRAPGKSVPLSDDDGWVCDSYRKTDLDRFGGGGGQPPHPGWPAYRERSANTNPRTIEVFENSPEFQGFSDETAASLDTDDDNLMNEVNLMECNATV